MPKITKKYLQRIIKEELKRIVEESPPGFPDPMTVPGSDPDSMTADPTVRLSAKSSIEEIVYAIQAMAKRIYK